MQQASAGPQPGSPLSPMARQQMDFHGSAGPAFSRPATAGTRLPALQSGPASSGGDSPPPSRGGRSPGSAAARSLNALLLGSPVRSGGTETAFAQAASRASTPGSSAPQTPQGEHQQRQQPHIGRGPIDQLGEEPTVSSLSVEMGDADAIRAAAAELADRHIAETLAAQRQAAERAARDEMADSAVLFVPQQQRQQHQHQQPPNQPPQGASSYQPAAASAAAARQLMAPSAPQPDNVLALKLTVVSGPSSDASYITKKDTRQVRLLQCNSNMTVSLQFAAFSCLPSPFPLVTCLRIRVFNAPGGHRQAQHKLACAGRSRSVRHASDTALAGAGGRLALLLAGADWDAANPSHATLGCGCFLHSTSNAWTQCQPSHGSAIHSPALLKY